MQHVHSFRPAIRSAHRLRRTLAAVLVILALAGAARAAEYHVDAVNGDDTTGNGTAGAPWQTIDRVWDDLTGGDAVVLYDGSYGTLQVKRTWEPSPSNLFDDWVTFRAADGAEPAFDKLSIGGGTGGIGDITQGRGGSWDCYMRFEGVKVEDGVLFKNARHWALVDCYLKLSPPYTGSVAAMERSAVSIQAGDDILIENCEITETSMGISGYGRDIRIRNCHIHGGSHDGIRVTGFWNSLIENNRIYDFDDTVADGEADWSRHCDLLHIFVPGGGPEGYQNHNVTIRGNVLYDAESQGVQFNNYYGNPTNWNEQILFENNIFGPTKANPFNNADPVDGLIFRGNTFVYFPDGRAYHEYLLTNHTLRITPNSVGVEVYNNILVNGGRGDFNDYNLVINAANAPTGVDDQWTFGRFTVVGQDPLYVDRAAFDGALDPASPAVNAGTRQNAPSPIFEVDRTGTPRDNRPDLGAWELPGQSPPPEPTPTIYNDTKTVFVDDFEDGHYKGVDPWLSAPQTQGMSWHRPDGVTQKYHVLYSSGERRNQLDSPDGDGSPRDAWLFSDQGADWADYTFQFLVHNAYLNHDGGVLVLAQDRDNTYWINLATDDGQVVRILDGVRTVLDADAAIRAPYHDTITYRITVAHEAGAVRIDVDKNADGDIELSVTDTDPAAVARFTGGGVGFHDNSTEQWHRFLFDDIRVEVSQFLDLFAVTQWTAGERFGAGPLDLPWQPGQTWSWEAGLRTLSATFGMPLDPATVGADAVMLARLSDGADVSHLISSIALSPDGRVLTVTLASALPDGQRYGFTLSEALRDTTGRTLEGDGTLVLPVLVGDVNSSGTVDEADVVACREVAGPVETPDDARGDVNASGVVDGTDLLVIRARAGNALP